ncbi:hypothetical protein NC653_037140 [Populus alba x Populus x berolinensis]|uniref:Uncharacterized protein n=1 Tax=Populus alba x Populus x berolinensis TaxID=444605 RepID=A0AAD6PVR9_9ROSI|nr:hypothetical protein NC653_037140 [Populus alba x Populus x berolinensis]
MDGLCQGKKIDMALQPVASSTCQWAKLKMLCCFIQNMKQSHCLPNLVTHNTPHGWAFIKPESARWRSVIWACMFKNGFSTGYNLLQILHTSGLSSCGRISELAWRSTMMPLKHGILPTSITWCILIRAVLKVAHKSSLSIIWYTFSESSTRKPLWRSNDRLPSFLTI